MEEEQKKKWYKDKYTLIFIVIMIVAIAIRFYYFWITKAQSGWWDEMDFMGAAKAYAGIGFADLTGQRLPGFPFVMSLFFRLGIQNEVVLRLLGCFIPSIIMLILLYLCVSKMYKDKRIALISMAIMAFLMESLFYSNRFQTENFGLIFQFLSLFFLYKFLENKKAIWLLNMAVMTVISVFMRPGQMLFIPAVVLFLIITQWKEHKKTVIISTAIMLLTAVGLMFIPSFNYIIMSNYNANHLGPAWNSIGFVEGLFSPWINIFFYIGVVVAILSIFKKNSVEKESDIFNMLLILTVLCAFIFIIRAPNYEFRWFFPLIISALVFISRGLVEVGDTIISIFKGKAGGKAIVALFIISVLFVGLYAQVSNADILIKNKVNTYADVRSAALWIKENTAQRDIIASVSYPQTAYYSERKVLSYAELNNSDQFEDFIMRTNPRFFTVSIYEPHPQWIYEWLLPAQENKIIYPAAVWFIDSSKTQPSLIVYGFIKDTIPANEYNESCDTTDICSI